MMLTDKPPTAEIKTTVLTPGADKPKKTVGKQRPTKLMAPATKSSNATIESLPKLGLAEKNKEPDGNCRVTKSNTKPTVQLTSELTTNKPTPEPTLQTGPICDTDPVITTGLQKAMPDWLQDRPHLRPPPAESYSIAPPPRKLVGTGPVRPVIFKKSSRLNQFGKIPKFNLWKVVQGKQGAAAGNRAAGVRVVAN